MSDQKTFQLNTGARVHAVGYGCFQGAPGDGDGALRNGMKVAFDAGYRHFDTAAFYENEEIVGAAIRDSGIKREDLFITTKLWNDRHHEVEKAFDESLERLGCGYVDMYLLHWPQATHKGDNWSADDSIDYIETWKSLEKLLETRKDKVRAIGVSNFSVKTLPHLLENCKVTPAMNQVECHPYCQENQVLEMCKQRGIVMSAYTPLGQANSPVLADPDINEIAKEVNASPGQVVLSWNVQRGVVVLPKSTNPARARQNHELVQLSDAQMQRIQNISKDPKRVMRLCSTFDPKTRTSYGWSYERLGWTEPEPQV